MNANEIRAALATKTNRPAESIFVKSFGMEMLFRHLSGLESDQLQLKMIDKEQGKVSYDSLKGQRARVVSLCLVDDQGANVFTAEEIGAWDNDVLHEVHGICRELNKLTKEEVDAEVKN